MGGGEGAWQEGGGREGYIGGREWREWCAKGRAVEVLSGFGGGGGGRG